MAVILASKYGSKKGTTAAKFRAYAALRVSQTDPAQGYFLQARRYLQFVPGSGYGGKDGFDGSTFWRNWGSDFKVYGNGKGDGSSKVYGDSGWVDVGWVAPGASYSLTAECGYSSSSLGALESSATVTVTVMSAPSSCSNVRVDDGMNTVSWTNGSGHDVVYLYRQVDGGSWSQLAQLSATVATYSDTATTADHAYAYRVRAYDSTAQAFSAYATSGTTYNTPAAPVIASVGRTSATEVEVTFENGSNTATALELQRSTDGSTWETVQTGVGLVTSITDNPGGGTFYYRARNTRGDLASAWSAASEAVVTVTSPAAPTILTPAASSVHASYEFVVVSWRHNPRDGSAQTAAKLEYTTDGWATYETVEVGGSASSYELPKFAGNYTVSIRIQTAGASGEYGAKRERTFSTAFAPAAFMSKPASVVTGMPIEFEVTYADRGGSLARVEVACLDEFGNQVWKHDSISNLDWEIYPDQWIPESGKEYTLVGMVRSTTTLTDAFESSFAIDFTPPQPPFLAITHDEDSMTTEIEVGLDDEAEGTYDPAVSFSVWRVTDAGKVLLASNLSEGDTIVDRYAPLNIDYAYEAVSMSALGAANAQSFPTRFETAYFAFMYGLKMARAKWNPKGSISVTRPAKKRVSYAGREFPVSYDGRNTSDERSLSFHLKAKAEADAFLDMVRSGGRAVYRSGDGEVFRCDVTASFSPAFMMRTYYGDVSVHIVRIDGEAV